MRKLDTQHWRMVLRLLVAALGVYVLGTSGSASVVLNPGYVTGTTGLSNWTFDGGSVSVSGTFFSGYANFTGGMYSVTVEGNQTYTAVSEYLYKYSPAYSTFSLYRTKTLSVPIGGAVTEDLARPGGTVQLTLGATGATVNWTGMNGYAQAYDSVAQESYSGYASHGGGGGSGTVQIPMAATSATVSVSGYVGFNITDSNGNGCYVQRSFSGSQSGLAEGAVATFNQTFDLTGESCPGVGHLTGTVSLNSLPSGASLLSGYVYAAGPGYQQAQFTSQPFTYSFTNLPVGSYYTAAWEAFDSPFASTLSLPNGGQYSTNVVANQTTTRDFVFDAAGATGTFTINGPLGSLPFNGSFGFGYDYTQSNPPNQGGWSSVPVNGPLGGPLSYGAVLTTGSWLQQNFNASIYDSTGSIYLNTYDNTVPALDASTAGAVVSFNRMIDTSEGSIVFDVIEPPGDPTIGISYPTVYANKNDGNPYVSIYAYGNASNEATPTVHVIGPPGHYEFDAYAQVQGSYTKFASSSIDLGQGVYTPQGMDVPVGPLVDADGDSLGVNLTFDEVTGAGQTTGSYTDVGPAPPDSFTLVPAFGGSAYLSINTTATFNGNVYLDIQYDPVALGLTPLMEGFLTLWHYDCIPGPCEWQNITDMMVTPNPDTAMHHIYGVTENFSIFALMLPLTDCSTDVTPPEISLAVSPLVLWPANHKLVPIQLNWTATDACDPAPVVSCSATSNEDVNGPGDGHTNVDIVWNNGQLSLRAERTGNASDRIYTIGCTAEDGNGNTSTATTTIRVPHDQR